MKFEIRRPDKGEPGMAGLAISESLDEPVALEAIQLPGEPRLELRQVEFQDP